jgi:hypothetical protein
MWLAIAACGGPPASTTPAMTTTTAARARSGISIYDAPPFAGATYIATVRHEYPDYPGPPRLHVTERGGFTCGDLVRLLAHTNDEHELVSAARGCDLEVARLLREGSGFVFVSDGASSRWLSREDVIAAATPIDTPAKALLVAWATGYPLEWTDGERTHGGIENGIVRAVANGYEVEVGARTSECLGNERERITYHRVTLLVDVAGKLAERDRTVSYRGRVDVGCLPGGRRPEDFVDVATDGTVRGYLLRAMHLEAESVRAFERIARELRALGAPDELADAALAAARDERDHAERCARLADAPLAIATDDLPVRGYLDLAIDNAIEGCVGEAYAALANVVQARTAAHPVLRAHFAAIATDELAHAALAHAIAAWLDGLLSPAERRQVHEAHAAAVRTLARSVALSRAPAELGLPTGAVAARLLEAVLSM